MKQRAAHWNSFLILCFLAVPARAQDERKVRNTLRTLSEASLQQALEEGVPITLEQLEYAFPPDEEGNALPLSPSKCPDSKQPVPPVLRSSGPLVTSQGTEVVAVIQASAVHPREGYSRANHPFIFDQDATKYWVEHALPPLPNRLGDWPIEELMQKADELSATGFKRSTGPFSYTSYMPEWVPVARRTFLIEGIIRYASQSAPKSEDELVDRISQAVLKVGGSSLEERKALFSTLIDRLYTSYNDKLNPQQNNGEVSVREASHFSFARMVNATASWNSNDGGVCTNYAYWSLRVGEKVFPDDDCAALNNGNHFAMMCQDKAKRLAVYNWDEVREGGGNQAILDPNLPVTNTQVLKMVDGRLQHIATLRTERGQVFDLFEGRNQPTMKTGLIPSVAYASILNGKVEKKIGVAETTSSQMIVVMAQKKGLSVGAAYEQMKTAGGNQNILVNVSYTG